MAIDDEGDIFVVTTNGLYFKKNELNTKYIKINNISGTVKEIHFNNRNFFNIIIKEAFIITDSGDYYYINTNNFEQQRLNDIGNLQGDVITMSIAKNGDVFVVTTNGLYFKKNELNTKYIKINNINGSTVKEIHFNDKNLFNIIMNGAFIITEYTKINNLRTDLVNIDDDVINLGIIDNNNDDTIFSALKKQNPNLDITQLEIIDKSDYSHFTENYSVKIKIKHNSTKYSYAYDNNILKATIIFNTKDNLNELSNKIRDNLMVKQWLKHVEDYNKNLSTKLENLNTFDDNQKWITKNIEKEIIKSYLRDFSQIIVLIENEWKLNELNNTVAGIKEDINNFKSEIKQLDQKIKDLGNLSASSSNWTCSNVTSLLGAVTSPIPVIGSIASTFFGISSAACAIANK